MLRLRMEKKSDLFQKVMGSIKEVGFLWMKTSQLYIRSKKQKFFGKNLYRNI